MIQNSTQKPLVITTKRRLFSDLGGEHASIFGGDGLDFRELREYNTQDDIRHINWRVSARTTSPCVNIFNEEKKLHIVVVYLVSGTIHFGSIRPKFEAMNEIFEILSLSALYKKDPCMGLFFSDKEEAFFPPMRQNSLLKKSIDHLATLEPLGKKIDFEKLNSYLLTILKHKSLVFVIGDFLTLPNFKLLAAKHELYIAIVRDRLEEDLKFLGDTQLIDPITKKGSDFFLDSESVTRYNQLLTSHDEALVEHFKKHKIGYQKIYTDQNVISKLRELIR